jgi:hypothetical protein
MGVCVSVGEGRWIDGRHCGAGVGWGHGQARGNHDVALLSRQGRGWERWAGLATRGWREACSCFQATTGHAGGGVAARRSYGATAWARTRDGSAGVDSRGRGVRRRTGYAKDHAVAGAGVCWLGLAAGKCACAQACGWEAGGSRGRAGGSGGIRDVGRRAFRGGIRGVCAAGVSRGGRAVAGGCSLHCLLNS